MVVLKCHGIQLEVGRGVARFDAEFATWIMDTPFLSDGFAQWLRNDFWLQGSMADSAAEPVNIFPDVPVTPLPEQRDTTDGQETDDDEVTDTVDSGNTETGDSPADDPGDGPEDAPIDGPDDDPPAGDPNDDPADDPLDEEVLGTPTDPTDDAGATGDDGESAPDNGDTGANPGSGPSTPRESVDGFLNLLHNGFHTPFNGAPDWAGPAGYTSVPAGDLAGFLDPLSHMLNLYTSDPSAFDFSGLDETSADVGTGPAMEGADAFIFAEMPPESPVSSLDDLVLSDILPEPEPEIAPVDLAEGWLF